MSPLDTTVWMLFPSEAAGRWNEQCARLADIIARFFADHTVNQAPRYITSLVQASAKELPYQFVTHRHQTRLPKKAAGSCAHLILMWRRPTRTHGVDCRCIHVIYHKYSLPRFIRVSGGPGWQMAYKSLKPHSSYHTALEVDILRRHVFLCSTSPPCHCGRSSL
jgi:hypothetical protein